MNYSINDIRKIAYDHRANWFNDNELLQIWNEAIRIKSKNNDCDFHEIFNHLIYVKSITEGKYPK